MSRPRVQLISLIAILLSFAGVALLSGRTSVALETNQPHAQTVDLALESITNYRQWTRANDVPLPVTIGLVSRAFTTGGT